MMIAESATVSNNETKQESSKPVLLFGANGARYVLEKLGGKATTQQMFDYVQKNHPGAITYAMLQKGANKLRERREVTCDRKKGVYYLVSMIATTEEKR